MSQQLQLLAIARHLSSLIDQQITSSPGEPQLIISALKMLIPETQHFLAQIQSLPNQEEQWNHVIHFIETQVFDDGMEFGFQKLDTQEIIEVYKVVVEMVQQAIGNQDQQQSSQNAEPSQAQHRQSNHLEPSLNYRPQNNQNRIQPQNLPQSNGSNQTASGEGSSNSNQNLQQVQIASKQPPLNSKNQQSINYLENVRKQQQKKKKEVENHQKPSQNKGKHKKQSELKQKNNQKFKNSKQTQQPNNIQQNQKPTDPRKHDKPKSSSVISKHQNKNSKLQQPSQSSNTKNVINKNINPSTEFNEKHTKSQNEPKKQRLKRERPNTAVRKLNQQKSTFQQDENNMKHKKSSINLNQNEKTHEEDFRPKSCSRNKRQANLMSQPLDQVVIQTIHEVMQKKGKKLSQRQLKSNPLMRDNHVTQMMKKAMRTYKYEAKNHKTEQKQKQQQKVMKSSTSSQNQPKKDNYIKLLKKKQQVMESEVLNSQLKYYYQLRDKKMAYIKHMHNMMEKLEKQRNIDLHKKQTQLTKQEKNKIKKKIQQADNLFKDNMKGIKDNYLKERQKNRVNAGDEIKVLTEIEKNLVKKKQNQLNLMKCLWEQERMKLDLIAKDQQKIKRKLEDMYRKNKV